uniref:Uncharacterized protein n=1 Tax=Arundo donax TaxID=35708 RepID=A0A0A9THL6_ARUDO
MKPNMPFLTCHRISKAQA